MERLKPKFVSQDRLESQVYRQLLDKIRFGNYALGERLPSENKLCKQHGVSRPIVRAALSKLRDSGLITSQQGSGSFVSSGVNSEQRGLGPLSSIEDISTFFEFRQIIESASVALAAEKGTKRDLRKLHKIVENQLRALERGGDAVSEDLSFHVTIAEISNNRFLIETLDMLRSHWFFVGNFVNSLGITEGRKGIRMTNEHIAIIEALESHNVTFARKAMIQHIKRGEERVFKG